MKNKLGVFDQLLVFFPVSIFFYLFLIVFYIPLRFSFGFLTLLPAYIFFIEIFLFVIALFFLRREKKKIDGTFIDVFIGLFTLYTAVLIVLQDGNTFDKLDAIRRYVAPQLLYWVVRAAFLDESQVEVVFKGVTVASFIVGCLYLAETIRFTFLEKGYFPWVYELKRYAISTGGGMSESQFHFGRSLLVRLAGVLGHNHATSFFIGVGSLCSLLFLLDEEKRVRKIIFFLIFLFLFLIVGLALCKTTILAFAIGLLFLLTTLKEKRAALIKSFSAAFSIVFTAFILASVVKPIIFFSFFKAGKYFLFQSIAPNLLINLNSVSAGAGYLELWQEHPLTFLFGTGFVGSQSISPIANDDLFYVEFFCRYGIFGFLIFLGLVVSVFMSLIKKIKVDSLVRASDLIPILYLVMILTMMSHSSILFFHHIFALLFIVIGTIRDGKKPTFN